MKKVVFYEKPGAARDLAQRAALAAAGYALDVRDQTTEHWTAAGLRAFFGERPISEWFDPSAQRSTVGEGDPARMNAQEALVALSVHPERINSPLVRYDGRCAAGLETEELLEFLEIDPRGGKPATVRQPPRTWGESWTGE
jgi:nitrogenase-associated protein